MSIGESSLAVCYLIISAAITRGCGCVCRSEGKARLLLLCSAGHDEIRVGAVEDGRRERLKDRSSQVGVENASHNSNQEHVIDHVERPKLQAYLWSK